MELVDVVDSKSTAGDSVPVRVRSPAPKKQIPVRVSAFLLTGRTRTAGESLGSESTAADGSTTWGPRKACFVGGGKAKAQLEFSACGKCNIVACALTKRVAGGRRGTQPHRRQGHSSGTPTGHRHIFSTHNRQKDGISAVLYLFISGLSVRQSI